MIFLISKCPNSREAERARLERPELPTLGIENPAVAPAFSSTIPERLSNPLI